MDTIPTKLKAKRQALVQPSQMATDDASWAGIAMPTQRLLLRRIRAIRRGALVLLWTALCMVIQSVLMLFPGRSKINFARWYWFAMCRLIGLQIRVIGGVAQQTADGRPIIFVSNHSSWLDILVLGAELPGCFIAKADVGRWPVVRTIARLGRTLYVSRNRASTAEERDMMVDRLGQGDNLILFPEGTTSDGSRVMPFRSAFMSMAELPVTPAGRTPIIQPISVVYDRLAGLPTGRAARPLFAWYGDMDIGSHFWRLAQHKGLRASVLLHQPLDPEAFPNRKALSQAVWAIVADGAATLRQNRPVAPQPSRPTGTLDTPTVNAATIQP